MSDARCGEFRELISAFVDEQLDGADLLRLEAHFAACHGCRVFEGELRYFKELLPAVEAFCPQRRPPPGFAAMVAARIARQPCAPVVFFPEADAGRRLSRTPWAGMIAAAAAAALFFAWSWQRLLPVGIPEQKLVNVSAPRTLNLAAADGGSMEIWMREHVELARGGTLLGSAEESEIARIHVGIVPER